VARGRTPVTNAAAADRFGRAERVERLLAGETLVTSGLSYDFDAHHVGVVAGGADALPAVRELTGSLSAPDLVVDGPGGVAWGWLAGDRDFVEAAAAELVSRGRETVGSRGAAARVAIGEPGRGLGGWRFSHQQARAALSVAMRGEQGVVRYGEVAVLASVLRDDLLAESLRRLYLEPLEGCETEGAELRRTLRAYFATGRSATAAGRAVGVTRQAVARRVRMAEAALGSSLAACGADLEVALRFEALGATPLSAL
jgi:hypothetical protein